MKMKNLFMKEIIINRDHNCIVGESGVFESCYNNVSDLYKDCKSEFGNPSNMYIDDADGKPVKVGWVFSTSNYYEDSPKEKYKQEVWVSVYTDKDETPYDFKKRK